MEKKIKNDERWRERVQKFERIRVGDILANDRNAKNHPKKQNDAVSQSLDTIGKAGTLMAYYSARNGGNLTLWDGHAFSRNWTPRQLTKMAIRSLEPLSKSVCRTLQRQQDFVA